MANPPSRSSARMIPCADNPASPEWLQAAAEALAAGKLVGLPTETVYALAARVDRAAALKRLDGLDGSQSACWLVAADRGLEHAFPLAPLARRIAHRYWPGPLTLAIRAAPAALEAVLREGWLRVRAPAQRGTQDLLQASPAPIVAKNVLGEHGRPATLAAQVLERFGGEVECIGDGGPARIGQESALLALGPGHFEAQRPGLLELSELRRAAGLKIAFVCTGNTCRSPMAEGLARQLLLERLGAQAPQPVVGDPDRRRDPAGRLAAFGFEVGSMGVAAAFGAPASAHAVEVLAQRGIDMRGHSSQPASLERLIGLDLALCLTRSHAQALEGLLPPGRGPRIELLDRGGRDVPDPIGGDLAAYRACAAAIEAALIERLPHWA